MISMFLNALRGGGVERFIAFGAFNSDAVRNFVTAYVRKSGTAIGTP
jgi:hypothetical protein